MLLGSEGHVGSLGCTLRTVRLRLFESHLLPMVDELPDVLRIELLKASPVYALQADSNAGSRLRWLRTRGREVSETEARRYDGLLP